MFTDSSPCRFGNQTNSEMVTIEELEKELPNGFHDAQIDSMLLDYRQRKMVIEMRLWTGDLTSKEKHERELSREARLIVTGLLFFIIEPPDPRYVGEQKVTISSSGSGSPPNRHIAVSAQTPENVFVHWFYVSTWNAFMHVAAESAQLELI